MEGPVRAARWGSADAEAAPAASGSRWQRRKNATDAADATAPAVAPAGAPAAMESKPERAAALGAPPRSEAQSGTKRKETEGEPPAKDGSAQGGPRFVAPPVNAAGGQKFIPPRFVNGDYSKPVPGAVAPPAAQAASGGAGHGGGSVPPPPVPKDDWEQRSSGTIASEDTICWNFKKGYCVKGKWCNWVHPGVSKGNAVAVGATRAFNEGSRVQIHGLVAKPELNDRVGECELFDMEASRWQVRLGNGQRLKIKESNLMRC